MNHTLEQVFYVAIMLIMYIGVAHAAQKQKVPHVTLHERLEKLDGRMSNLEEKYQGLSKKIQDIVDNQKNTENCEED